MSPWAVEINFLGLERPAAKRTALSSIRDIQKAVSRMNPQLLRSLIASGTTANPEAPSAAWPHVPSPSPFSRPPSPHHEVARQPPRPPHFSQMPVLNPSSRSVVENPAGCVSAPLTIFYNGTVAVFDVSPDMAEVMMRFAENEKAMSAAAAPNADHIPLARKRSLLMFLEKRRERLTAAAPYIVPSASSSNTTGNSKARADSVANKWKQ